jgi:protein-S-isoprenylcysteine O-methyltransferase Ste14
MTGGARLISAGALLSCLIFLLLTWSIDQHAAFQLLGVAIMATSLALFWAAVRASSDAKLRFAFDEALPSTLVTGGPYKYVRHPFYTSYLMFWTGWALATSSPWALIPVLVMAALYTIAARYEESLLISSSMSSHYSDYRNSTGMFWPRVTRAQSGRRSPE